jgi:hypothetical protein
MIMILLEVYLTKNEKSQEGEKTLLGMKFHDQTINQAINS